MNDEQFTEILVKELHKAYRKGYNDACEVLANAFRVKGLDSPEPLKYIFQGVGDTIIDCKLKKE